MESDLLFSAASAWEMAIKRSLGKLRIEGSLGPYLTRHLTNVAVEVSTVKYLKDMIEGCHHHDTSD